MQFPKKKRKTATPRRRQPSSASHGAYDEATDNLFRRNRTLTGSSSAHIRAAADGIDASIASPRTRAHQLVATRRKITSVLICIVLTVGLIGFLLSQFTAYPRVAGATEMTQPLVVDEYEQVIGEYLAGRPIQRFRFALDEAALLQSIQETVPEVEALQATKGSVLGESRFILQLRAPVASWTIGDTQYFVDASGVSFTQNYGTTPAVSVIDNSGIAIQAGETIVSNRLLAFAGRAVSYATESGIAVKEVRIPEGTTRRLDIQLQNPDVTVRMTIDRPVGEQVEDMARALRHFAATGSSPSMIDVRVSGRAAYQ